VKGAKAKRPKLSALAKKAWGLFAKQVKQGAADHSGFVRCVSCGTYIPWQSAHAGHFVHCSKQSPLSYDKRNVHPQCRQCNYYGMQGLAAIRYTQFIQSKYGSEVVNELLDAKHSKIYMKRLELEELIEKLETA
jgi:hypothetical protein